MEEKTITEAPEETGAQALPVEAEQAPAEKPVETAESEEQKQEPASGAQALPDKDEQLQKFAQSHGLELDSPSAIKAAKMAMDNQAEYQRNRQKASELEKSLSTTSDEVAEQVAQNTGQDPELLKRLQRVEVKDAVRDFYDQNPDARTLEKEMIAELQGRPHLAGDLEALYAVVKAKNLNAVKSQGKREALESLAHKQQAAVPTGSATNHGTPKEKPFDELSISEMEAKLGFVRR